MKNILSLLLVVSMAFSMGACATADTSAVSADTSSTAKVETAVINTSTPTSEYTPVTTSVVTPAVQESKTEVASQPAATSTTTAQADDNRVATTISGGGYVVDVVKASIVKDGLGNDCIGIRFKFTNNNSDQMAFVYIAMDTVTQDGKTLSMEGMVTNPEDPTQTNLCQWVSNGQSVDVTYIYPYNSSSDINFSLTLVKDLNSITPLGSGSCTLSLN